MCLLYITLAQKLSIPVDMIVEIQVTQLLTWNFARSVTNLRYFSDQLVDVTHFVYSNFWKEQSTNLQ